jgi:hypothetical protein
MGRLPAALICSGLLVLLVGWRIFDVRWSAGFGSLLLASGVGVDVATHRRRRGGRR